VQGRTRTNKVVNLAGDHRPGEFVTARIDRAHPHHLSGRVLQPAVSA
jgi:tRNA A37 methylthiotransferase MiaB